MHDLSVIVTCMHEADWVEGAIRSILSALAGIDAEIVIAAIDSDGSELTRAVELSETIRIVPCRNGGFAHANNEALRTCSARYVLFLNPDTEHVQGSFRELLERFDQRPEVGLVGIRQLTPDGGLYPTMRRETTVMRMLGEALGSERFAPGVRQLGQRRLDLPAYEREQTCDWTIGSFMLVRREAILSAGFMDERFFFGVEEEDFCLRIRQAGWTIAHSPLMTIVHHVNKAPFSARMVKQRAWARTQYAHKHFRPVRRTAFLASLAAFHLLRGISSSSREHRVGYRGALRVIFGTEGGPFGPTPRVALPPHSARGRITECGGEPE